MSLVNYYKCDVCDKPFLESELYRFTKRYKCFSLIGGVEIQKDNIDICEKCLERIRSEIKKEGN
jgi:hypothetical protein